jgi:ribosomal protein S12 methylthiotransferase accessory factor
VADNDVLERLETLVSPFGVVADVQARRAPRGLSALNSFTAFSALLPSPRPWNSGGVRPPHPARTSIGSPGLGVALADPVKARLIAIAEAAERYSATDFQQPVVWAPYRELDGTALDPRRIPRCSARELMAPGCPLGTFSPGPPIRWVRGIDLTTGIPTWLPAVMAFYGLNDTAPAERFWYRISTGFAVHSDPVEALVRGICEVIERDALMITWLQRLRLPVVSDDRLSSSAQDLLAWSRRHFIDTYLFDATTDMGVPAIFCLQLAPHDARRAQLVSCATARSIGSAVDKVLMEACQSHFIDHDSDDPPADFADFYDLVDSANYMAMPSRAPAFSFLVDGARRRVAPERENMPDSPLEFLDRLIATLSAKDMQVLAVDRTTCELAEAGLTAVNVVIPDLQPMSLLPLAQYRAHPRLYSAPVQMGYPSLKEEELNPWPVPYA